LTDEEIIESVIGINKDDIDEEDDESSAMEPPSQNEAIKAAITLNNFLLSYEKTTPEVLTMLRKIRDEIQEEIDFNKKQKTIERVGISAKKEAHVNFLTDLSDGRSPLRLTDVLVFSWVGGKHACVDLTGVSPLVGLRGRGFTAGQAALKAASGKVAKHEKACIENQHVFIPFTFDTFGFLAPEAVELLSRVQRVMHNNVMTPRSTNVVFKHIGFVIQKGLAAQLVARLPSTTM
nr:putative exostosin-like protein [Tanacetum cinerariifolium]